MDLRQLIEALTSEYQDKGNMSVRVDLDGVFRKVTHTDIANLRDEGESVPVLFLNLENPQ